MNPKQMQRLSNKYLVPRLGDFISKGLLLYTVPLGDILRGFYFEDSSSNKTSFTITIFFQPLYVPCDHIYFTFGNRLGRVDGGAERWWELSDENEVLVMNEVLDDLVKKGLPLLDVITTPADFAKNILSLFGNNPRNIHVIEAIAYSHVLSNKISKSVEALELMPAIIEKMVPTLDWHLTILERTEKIRNALSYSEEHAIKLLEGWKAETIKNLSLSSRSNKSSEKNEGDL